MDGFGDVDLMDHPWTREGRVLIRGAAFIPAEHSPGEIPLDRSGPFSAPTATLDGGASACRMHSRPHR